MAMPPPPGAPVAPVPSGSKPAVEAAKPAPDAAKPDAPKVATPEQLGQLAKLRHAVTTALGRDRMHGTPSFDDIVIAHVAAATHAMGLEPQDYKSAAGVTTITPPPVKLAEPSAAEAASAKEGGQTIISGAPTPADQQEPTKPPERPSRATPPDVLAQQQRQSDEWAKMQDAQRQQQNQQPNVITQASYPQSNMGGSLSQQSNVGGPQAEHLGSAQQGQQGRTQAQTMELGPQTIEMGPRTVQQGGSPDQQR